MKNIANSKQSPLKIVVAIIAVIVVIMFATAGMRISESASVSHYDYDERDYLYPVESGRYGMLYETAIQDMGKKKQYTAEVSECRALAFYYEQAVLEHAFRTVGDNAKAREFANRMAEYEADLGTMSDKASDVREAVGD